MTGLDDLTFMHDKTSEYVKYNIYTSNEIRELCGLKPIRSEDAHGVKENLKITNCVNCGAVIDPTADHCAYCDTSYALMGLAWAPTTKNLELENEIILVKTKALADVEKIKALYEEALTAMRRYGRRY